LGALTDAHAVRERRISGTETGWDRTETAQLGEKSPDLVHGEEADNYGRKREV